MGVRVPSCAQRSGRHRLDAGRFFCGFAARLARLKPQVIAASLQVMRLGVRGYGVRPLCGRQVWGRRDPKLRSAYLGFSGVSPLRGFVAAEAVGYRDKFSGRCRASCLRRDARHLQSRYYLSALPTALAVLPIRSLYKAVLQHVLFRLLSIAGGGKPSSRSAYSVSGWRRGLPNPASRRDGS